MPFPGIKVHYQRIIYQNSTENMSEKEPYIFAGTEKSDFIVN